MRVGTRASKLARIQTDLVVQKLGARELAEPIDVLPITTGGDTVQDKPIAEIGVRGVFVKELEEALLAGEVDCVVHSLKDMPTDMPDGLCLAAVLDREDPRDVLVSRNNTALARLDAGSRIATSSRRRTAQLSSLTNGMKFADIRGNIETRLNKMDNGDCEAMILAAAGLLRLGLGFRIAQFLDPSECTPAAGQGALAVQCRADDHKTRELLKELEDPVTRLEVDCERAYLKELGGGCSVPIGILARAQGRRLQLTGCIASLEGDIIFRDVIEGGIEDPVSLGRMFAEKMVDAGARDVVDSLIASTAGNISPP